MEKEDKKKRRSFLKEMFTLGASLGLLGIAGKKAKAEPAGEKIKLLTPDGKLVEIDRAHIEKESTERASKTDVLNWMNPSQGLNKK
jgi:hypothetical protein